MCLILKDLQRFFLFFFSSCLKLRFFGEYLDRLFFFNLESPQTKKTSFVCGMCACVRVSVWLHNSITIGQCESVTFILAERQKEGFHLNFPAGLTGWFGHAQFCACFLFFLLNGLYIATYCHFICYLKWINEYEPDNLSYHLTHLAQTVLRGN